MNVRHFVIGLSLAMIADLANGAVYYKNKTSDSLGQTAFTRLESWDDENGVTVPTNGSVLAEDVFNETNDFVAIRSFRAWDNSFSNRFACASLTLGDVATKITVTWKPYGTAAVIDNCIWSNAVLSVNNDRTHVMDGKWTVMGEGETAHQFKASGGAMNFNMRQEMYGEHGVSVYYDGFGNVDKPNQLIISGDFSHYKGQIRASKCAYVALNSPTATGEVSEPREDAILLDGDGGFMINPAVQDQLSPLRGICLHAGTNCLYTDKSTYKAYVVKVPITGNETEGTLKKIGPGEVTLDCAYTANAITVSEGRLNLAYDFTAQAGQKIYVAAGATLFIENIGTALSCDIEKEDGAVVIVDGAVKYDPETGKAQPLDFTSATPEAWAAFPKPLDIRLSAAMPLPINETNRLVVAKFPQGADVTADMFSDVSPKTYGLPHSWFEIGTDDESGAPVLLYVSKPAITRTGVGRLLKLDSQFIEKTETPVWSDGLAAHPGADYLQTNTSENKTWDGYDGKTRAFPGDSLYMTAGKFGLKSAGLVLNNLTIDGTVEFSFAGPGNGKQVAFLGGPYTVTSGHSLAVPGGVGSDGSVFGYSINAEVRGAGGVSLSHSKERMLVSVLGTNTAHAGKWTITSNSKLIGPETNGLTVAIAHPYAFGGPMEKFTYDMLVLSKYCFVRPLETMTFDATNRGISIPSSAGGFDVPGGVRLTIRQIVRNNANSTAALIKDGAGTLKLDMGMRFGYAGTNLLEGVNNILRVRDGWLMASNDPKEGYARNDIRFDAGTGIEIDADVVNEWGVYAPLANGIMADESIVVKVNASENFLADKIEFTVPVCTVTNTLGALSFSCVRSIRGWRGKVTSSVVEGGLTRYSMTCSRQGAVIFLR